MRNTLRTVGASKSFGGIRALQEVSIEISEGAIIGLIGANGSGKTTLVHVVTGVLQPDSGQVFLGDTDITGWRTDRIACQGIGRTFQVTRLFGTLSVVDNVELGVMSTLKEKDVDGTVKHLLNRLKVDEWASQGASILPYGVQRRVEIARALGAHPRFLLLDEPAAGLNEEESHELLEMIYGISKDPDFGCGVLIIDHNPRLILRLCERICVLDKGRVLAEGTPQEIRSNPKVIEAYLGESYASAKGGQ